MCILFSESSFCEFEWQHLKRCLNPGNKRRDLDWTLLTYEHLDQAVWHQVIIRQTHKAIQLKYSETSPRVTGGKFGLMTRSQNCDKSADSCTNSVWLVAVRHQARKDGVKPRWGFRLRLSVAFSWEQKSDTFHKLSAPCFVSISAENIRWSKLISWIKY